MELNFEELDYKSASFIAANIRQADKDELWASHHFTPEQGILVARGMSLVSYAVSIDGCMFMAFGVAPLGYRRGVSPWMLATDDIHRFPITFYRHTRNEVARMFEAYQYLENHVDSRNVLSIRWLKWCGFKMHPAEPFGVEQLPFHRFSLGGD